MERPCYEIFFSSFGVLFLDACLCWNISVFQPKISSSHFVFLSEKEMKTEESQAMIRWAGLPWSRVFIFLTESCCLGLYRTGLRGQMKIDETKAAHAVMGNCMQSWFVLGLTEKFSLSQYTVA